VSNMIEFEINAILAIVTFAGYLACMRYMIRKTSCIERSKTQSQHHSREQIRQELIAQLETHYNSRSIIRMNYDAFTRLVAILHQRGLLRDNQYSIVEDYVAKFLHIYSGHSSTQAEGFFFRRSTETISRHFHQVLRAIITLEDQFLVQNCIGALDRTHIRVKVPKENVSRYRGRKGFPTMNSPNTTVTSNSFSHQTPTGGTATHLQSPTPTSVQDTSITPNP
ncbi:hypothetical protein S245_004798, partial [Arachis hypogaea]